MRQRSRHTQGKIGLHGAAVSEKNHRVLEPDGDTKDINRTDDIVGEFDITQRYHAQVASLGLNYRNAEFLKQKAPVELFYRATGILLAFLGSCLAGLGA